MSLRRLLVFLALALLGAAPSLAGDEDERSERVFRRVQAAVHAPQTPHFNSRNVQRTTIVRDTVPEAGRPIFMPILPPGCGMGVFGGLDVEGTLELATDLYRLYGLELQPDLAAAGVDLDRLDPKAKVGLLIRPAAPADVRMPVKPGSTQEIGALERAGYRVLVLPGDRYRCMQGDTSSPMHAGALTIVDFLASATGTPPVDVAVLSQGQSTDLEGTGLEGGIEGASTFELSETGAFVVLEKEATVALSFVPPADLKGKKRPTLLVLPFHWTPPTQEGGASYDFEAAPPSFTLVQAGAPPMVSGRAVFLTDGTFDPTRSFRILVTLRPGQTHIGHELRMRTSTELMR